MKDICKWCQKEFELSKHQIYASNKDHFCSRSCASFYKNYNLKQQKFKEIQTTYICSNCNKAFKVDYKKAVYWKNSGDKVKKHFCSDQCKVEYKDKIHQAYNIKKKEYKKEYRYKNKKTIQEKAKKKYSSNPEHFSLLYYGISDYAPNQHNKIHDSRAEKQKFINKLVSANTIRNKNNKYSCRKGICYLKNINKWQASLYHDGKPYSKLFETEEAIAYRIYLEDTYYTPEQLVIRNKYRK